MWKKNILYMKSLLVLPPLFQNDSNTKLLERNALTLVNLPVPFHSNRFTFATLLSVQRYSCKWRDQNFQQN